MLPTVDTSRPRWSERLARWSIRRRRLVVVGLLVTVALSGWRTSTLMLKTDLVELLPQDAPAVTTLRRMDARLEALPSVLVVIESPLAEANRRFVDTLVLALQRLQDQGISDVEWGVREQREFYRRNGYLYVALEDLQDAHGRLEREILRRKNPAFISLSDDEAATPTELDGKKAVGLLDRFPDDHFATADGTVYAIVVRLKGSLLGENSGEQTLRAIEHAILVTQPQTFHPAMKVGLTGNVVSGLAERHALEDDLALVTIVCTLLVALVMFLFFRSPGLMLWSVVPAGAGVLLALAFAQLTFGFLNASTAFMGAIILGNGINYAIIQSARYQEERRQGAAPAEAAVAAVKLTWRATGIAALSAAVAYAALAATSFRGFSQFGYIGAAGMVLSWIVTLVALPALWVCCDRRGCAAYALRSSGFDRAAESLTNLVLRAPRVVLVTGAALAVLSGALLPRYLRDPFEYDFRKLGNQSRERAQVEALSRKLDPIFGRSLSPGVVLLDQPRDAKPVKEQLRARDPERAIIAKITSVHDLLPGDDESQVARLEVLDRIRRLIDRNLGLLDEKERVRLEAFRPPDGLRPLSAVDLPASLRRYYTERDGTVGRPLLYFPPTTVSVWDGKYLLSLAGVVESVRLEDGRTVQSSGPAVVFATMLRAIIHDGPIVSAVALLGVSAVLLGLSGWRRDSLVGLGALLTGVLWMVGAAAAASVRVNFLNFIALPITFGIGVDYAVNLLQRRRLEGQGGVRRTMSTTGGAVTLCSLTTIIGYAALLCADNHALRSFGALAILGELSCLTVSLTLLPAFFAVRDQGLRGRWADSSLTTQVRPAGKDT